MMMMMITGSSSDDSDDDDDDNGDDGSQHPLRQYMSIHRYPYTSEMMIMIMT